MIDDDCNINKLSLPLVTSPLKSIKWPWHFTFGQTALISSSSSFNLLKSRCYAREEGGVGGAFEPAANHCSDVDIWRGGGGGVGTLMMTPAGGGPASGGGGTITSPTWAGPAFTTIPTGSGPWRRAALLPLLDDALDRDIGRSTQDLRSNQDLSSNKLLQMHHRVSNHNC